MPTPDTELSALVRARTLDVAILLFPDVEVLDFAGPFEVFSVAARIHRGTEHRPFRVSTVAAERVPVAAHHGLPVIANHSFAEQPRADVLIVPGGIVDQPLGDPHTLTWLSAASKEAMLTASVCTGAFLLAKIGLLKGRTATTHWEDIPALRAAHPDLSVVEDVPYVDEGRIVTSAGISAGIDMSLHLVERLAGADTAAWTARRLEYVRPAQAADVRAS